MKSYTFDELLKFKEDMELLVNLHIITCGDDYDDRDHYNNAVAKQDLAMDIQRYLDKLNGKK